MKNIKSLLVFAILIVISNHLLAQQKSIPLCNKIEVVNVALEKKLNLFTEYDGFQQALLFKENEDLYFLEIIYKPKDILQVERKPLTKAELAIFCEKINVSGNIDELLALNQDGRTELLISSTLSGLAFYGWSLPLAAGIDDSRATIATYMLVGGSSFFVPFLATRNREVTKAIGRAYSVGTVTGIGHGFMLRGLLELNNQYPNYDERKSERRLLVPIALGLGESFGLMALTSKYDLSIPNVSMIASGSVWGAGWGMSVGSILIAENDDSNTEIRKALFSTLIGSGTGMYLGHKVYQKTPNLTNGDVLVVNAYGVLAALSAATISDLAMDFNKNTDTKILYGSMTATSIGGMIYGLHRTKNYNYTNAEGAYIGLSEIAGGLLGLGIGYLVDDSFSSETALVSTTIGATTGLLLVDNYLRKRSLKVNTSIGNFDFGFNPMGIANAFQEDNKVKDLEYYQRSTNNYIIRAAMTF